MDWRQLCAIANALRGVETEASRIVVAGQPIARLVDPKTIAFMLADASERDALIERAPSVFFISPRFAEMPVVLAHLDKLDPEEARMRLRAAWKVFAPAKPEKPAEQGPQLYYLAYVKDHDKPERRTFRRLGHGTVAEWLLAAWRAFLAGKAWGHKIPDIQLTTIEHRLQRAVDDEVACPKRLDDAALAVLAEIFEAGPHIYSDGGDDDEGLEWEFVIFDDAYFADERSDYLPHPDRGDRKSVRDDGYRELLAKHGKHLARRSR